MGFNLPTLAELQATRRATPKPLPRALTKPKDDKTKADQGKRKADLSARHPRDPHRRAPKPRPCVECGAVFIPRHRSSGGWTTLCSVQCSRVRRAPIFVRVTCAQCARMFERRADNHDRRYRLAFCNIVCRGKFLKGPNHALYRGDCDPNRGRAWIKLAENIRTRDGHVCQRCGRTQQENRQRLSVDHIKPWRSFADKAQANHPNNLTSLCRKCHAQKTAAAERQWLMGDVLALEQYERAVKLPALRIVKETVG